jgi:glycosyltransferase involved in cell wall biosynthesis
VINEPQAIATLRARYGINGEPVLGHFGTYNPHDRKVLREVVAEVLEKNDSQKILLMGRGSDSMREELVRHEPLWKDSIYGSGELTPRELSLHLSACDVMVQPCQDGVSSRRTTVMAALAHGKPIVTTIGGLTDSIWSVSQAVLLAPCEDTKGIAAAVKGLLNDRKQREHLGVGAHNLYHQRFDIDLVITTLRNHSQ